MKFAVLVLVGLLFTLSRSELYSISKFEGPPFSVKPASGNLVLILKSLKMKRYL